MTKIFQTRKRRGDILIYKYRKCFDKNNFLNACKKNIPLKKQEIKKIQF